MRKGLKAPVIIVVSAVEEEDIEGGSDGSDVWSHFSVNNPGTLERCSCFF